MFLKFIIKRYISMLKDLQMKLIMGPDLLQNKEAEKYMCG